MDKSNKVGVVSSSQKRDTSHGDYAPASKIKHVQGAFGEGAAPTAVLENEEARQRVEEGDEEPDRES